MTNAYLILKQKHQDEVNNFPMAFAFSDKQFEEAMEKLGLSVTDTDKVYSIGGGGIIRKTDSNSFGEMLDRQSNEMKEAIDADETGEGFVLDMFDYELANHEYGYTMDIKPTLNALGITFEELNSSKKLQHGLKKAKEQM